MSTATTDERTRTPRAAADELVMIANRLTALGVRPVYIDIDQSRGNAQMRLQLSHLDDLYAVQAAWGLTRQANRSNLAYASGVVDGVQVTVYAGTGLR